MSKVWLLQFNFSTTWLSERNFLITRLSFLWFALTNSSRAKKYQKTRKHLFQLGHLIAKLQFYCWIPSGEKKGEDYTKIEFSPKNSLAWILCDILLWLWIVNISDHSMKKWVSKYKLFYTNFEQFFFLQIFWTFRIIFL